MGVTGSLVRVISKVLSVLSVLSEVLSPWGSPLIMAQELRFGSVLDLGSRGG